MCRDHKIDSFLLLNTSHIDKLRYQILRENNNIVLNLYTHEYLLIMHPDYTKL
jgi:hypothetical protein